MKRLLEEDAQSPLLRDAQRLLEAVEPLEDSDARMQRVRRSLDRPRRRAGAFAPGPALRGGALGRIPALALSGLVVLFGASAFAAVRYIAARSAAVEQHAAAEHAATKRRKAHERAQPTAVAGSADGTQAAAAHTQPVAPAAQSSVPRASVSGSVIRTITPTPQLNEPAVPPAGTAGSLQQQDEATSVPADRTVLESTRAPRITHSRALRARKQSAALQAREEQASEDATSAASGGESTLVHRAVQALRRDGDPALAARLLAESRKHSSSGPLAEEALSLQIEAASALGNGKASGFAREYLARYPTGRYASLARDALRAR